jgi:HK97 family phage major capsid protein
MPSPTHEREVLLADIFASIKSAEAGVVDFNRRASALEVSVNDLLKQMHRPHGGGGACGDVDERAQAVELLEQKHFAATTKRDVSLPEPSFSEEQVGEAKLAIAGIRALMHSTSIDQVPLDQRKALSSFSFGSQGFLLAPEMSQTILSCLETTTDIAGLMRNITISGPSIKFMVDNEVWDVAAWACESSCFANNPTQQIGSGLGELEIKPEPLRYVICATRDLLEDSGVNLEQWMLDKVRRAFTTQVSAAVLAGDGFGKPMGILHPGGGIPICETAEDTPSGQFRWQDLVALRWQVPVSLQGFGVGGGGAYLMNAATWSLCATMSDTNGRPIMTAAPSEAAPFLLGGVPVVIAQQMPDVMPGATPIAYGNWQEAYTVVNRKAVTMMQDPFSVGFCILYRFEARIGGGIICPNAARLLRIR